MGKPAWQITVPLSDEAATDRLGGLLATCITDPATILLSGPLGAGKSHLARALILEKLAAEGRHEDIPSPTFTLIQTYDTRILQIIHADLYRLGDVSELDELGLLDAFDDSLCLIEWPERLGDLAPRNSLWITLTPNGTGRTATLWSQDTGWSGRLDGLNARA